MKVTVYMYFKKLMSVGKNFLWGNYIGFGGGGVRGWGGGGGYATSPENISIGCEGSYK